MVLSQVIPSEVQDSTGDNIEKPGKIFNGETSMCFHILSLACTSIFFVDEKSWFFSVPFYLCTICFTKLTVHQTWLLYFYLFIYSLVQGHYLWHHSVAAVSSCQAQSLDRESLVML